MMRVNPYILGLVIITTLALQVPCSADPGELFAERKAALVKQFDANSDGRLNKEERLAMRHDQIETKKKKNSRGGRGFMPPVLVKAYDTNDDGEIDQQEQAKMGMDMGKRRQKFIELYDLDKDGEINQESERNALQKGIKEGRHDEVDTFMSRFMFGRRRGGGMESEQDTAWKAFDRNNNGVAEAEELEAMRASKKEKQ